MACALQGACGANAPRRLRRKRSKAPAAQTLQGACGANARGSTAASALFGKSLHRVALGNVADEVTHCDGGRWPEATDGGGSGLELVDPRQDNGAASSWAASDETAKAQWTRIEYTKPHTDGRSEFQMFLTDDGVALIDDLALRRNGTNLLPEGDFDRNVTRWRFGGTHKHSHVHDGDAHSGRASLRLVATGGGDPGINGAKAPTARLAEDAPCTVSYWAKWQSGANRLVTRTHTNGVAQANALPVPERLGTPGRRNSRSRPNVGPAISALRHTPVTPDPQTTVAVYASLSDADGDVASPKPIKRFARKRAHYLQSRVLDKMPAMTVARGEIGGKK